MGRAKGTRLVDIEVGEEREMAEACTKWSE